MSVDRRGRRSGLLLHPTSLPSPGGIGTLGQEAFAFVDFLASAQQRVWQVLPLTPTSYGDSPYASTSAFAGNPMMIDLQHLVDEGWLRSDPMLGAPRDGVQVPFEEVVAHKRRLLDASFEGFSETSTEEEREAFELFCDKQSWWLGDFALFSLLRELFDGASWSSWPDPLRERETSALQKVWVEHRRSIERICFIQWVFWTQWSGLKDYANSRGISIMGDIPIFVAYDSADVWSNQEIFWLDELGHPLYLAGVPPDYFSETGQLWGNPLYRWDTLEARGYDWWVKRFRSILEMVDEVRIDHFRGFAAYWEVPAGAKTAINGQWVKGPGRKLFDAVRAELGDIGIIAEDLGVITPDVSALRDGLQLPGMKVLHFAFGSGASNGYLPHNYTPRSVVYTGTHDNDTTVGWYLGSPDYVRDHIRRYGEMDGNDIAWQLMRLGWQSSAELAIAPVQDILGLGSDARMNTPGTAEGNWGWRLSSDQLAPHHAERLARLTRLYARDHFEEERDDEEDYVVVTR